MRGFVSAVAVALAVVFAAAPSQAAKSKTPTGYLVVSIESDQKRETLQTLEVRRQGGRRTWLIFTPGFWAPKFEFSTNRGVGSVLVKELPEGDYVTVGMSADVEGAHASVPIEIPFAIHAGKATYLGAFRPQIGDKQAGLLEKPHTLSYEIHDERARDLPMAAKKLPAGLEVVEAQP